MLQLIVDIAHLTTMQMAKFFIICSPRYIAFVQVDLFCMKCVLLNPDPSCISGKRSVQVLWTASGSKHKELDQSVREAKKLSGLRLLFPRKTKRKEYQCLKQYDSTTEPSHV